MGGIDPSGPCACWFRSAYTGTSDLLPWRKIRAKNPLLRPFGELVIGCVPSFETALGCGLYMLVFSGAGQG